jgi:hypothetical protein
MSIAVSFYCGVGRNTIICNKYFGLFLHKTSVTFVRTENFLINSPKSHSMSIIIRC